MALSFALSLVGCTTPTPPPEPVTIRFGYLALLTGGGTEEYYELAADEFGEEHSHVTFDIRAWSPFEPCDVVVAPEFFIQNWREEEYVRSLDGLIERDVSFDLADFHPEVVDVFTHDGEVWGIPFGTDVLVMYYNRDLFDAYAVPYPQAGWTWDDFLDRALALRDESAGIYGYAPWRDETAGAPGDYAPWRITPRNKYVDAALFFYQHGGRLVDDLQDPTRAVFDEPLNVEALEWYADLIHRHDVAPSPDQTRSDLADGLQDPFIGVISGKVGMWGSLFSDQGTDVPWSFEWGMVPLPHDAQMATLAWSWGYAITSEAMDPNTCWEWVAFLSERMPQRTVPGRIALAESKEFERRAFSEVARAALESTLLVPVEALWAWDDGRTMMTFEAVMRKIDDGSMTAQEALGAAQEMAE
jgi:multiple sugar transport system substrate-binding protein